MRAPLIIMSMNDKESPCAALRKRGVYRLLAWLSPSFPTGAFSYSHGLEAAVESGAVRDRTSLQDWINAIITSGSGRIDADILREAHRAAAESDLPALMCVNRRGMAFRATAEMRLETAAQGAAFLATCRAAWPDAFVDRWAERLAADNEAVCYAAAIGAATARAHIDIECTLNAYLQALTAKLVSAGLRFGILGQTDGQRILAALEPVIAEAGAKIRNRDQFGTATFAVELASMAHETQYSRLFRS
jgi:urease accessory protein